MRMPKPLEPVRAARREVYVRLTVAQVDALLSLCAYASAGGPDDVGMERGSWNRLDAAAQRLARAEWGDE
jgi:hypothetical protein